MSDVVRGRFNGTPRRSFDEFTPFSPTMWQQADPPQVDWMVEGCFVRGTVAIMSGDGGLGKSLLLQQLVTAAATGRKWLGLRTAEGRSLCVFCEDPRDELFRRQVAINKHYSCHMDDLDPIMMESRAGRDCVLMRFPRWGDEGELTPMFEQVEQAAEKHGAQYIILDTLADVFAGNEVDRNQPRTFIRALRRLALKRQGVVILTQHPSVQGLAAGTGASGSTGWNNSVRSRLYLTLPKRKKDETDTPTNTRYLKTMKNNSGPFGGKISVTWRDGVFVRDDEEPTDAYWRREDELEF